MDIPCSLLQAYWSSVRGKLPEATFPAYAYELLYDLHADHLNVEALPISALSHILDALYESDQYTP